MSKVVILHSGGLDSTVCLHLALEAGHDALSVGVNYGQTHQVEMDYAERQCQKLGVERKVIHVRWEKPQRAIPMGRTVEEITAGRSTAFLPGRNIIFIALACAEAAGSGAAEVWTGLNQIEFSGYPDCTDVFADRFRDLLGVGMPGGPRLMTPLMNLSKPAIAREARRLGLGPDDTWSCYRPVILETKIHRCGKCDACVLHAHAWENIDA